MITYFMNLNHIIQALLATTFTWFVTILGSSVVFIFKKFNRTFMNEMLGFASGIMISSSFFSLINPSIDVSEKLGINSFLIPTIGFVCGGLLLYISDKIFNLLSKKGSSTKKRIVMLISSITIHNIPEGLSVGIAFGMIGYNLEGANIVSACLLALGIGLQNFPEGSAVSMPLLREGYSKKKAFIYGMLSAVVEPISGVIGAILVLRVRNILPFFLSFAAGAMIYTVCEELIPESQNGESKENITLFTIMGFAIMMILDLALG